VDLTLRSRGQCWLEEWHKIDANLTDTWDELITKVKRNIIWQFSSGFYFPVLFCSVLFCFVLLWLFLSSADSVPDA
jgi:hypothetical protein